MSIVLKGKSAMPSWAPTLNDVEIASVITYERNSWGNHTGDILQPKQVAGCAQRQAAGRRRSSGRRGRCGGGAASAPRRAGCSGCFGTQLAAPAAARGTGVGQRGSIAGGSLPASIYFETGKSTLPADAKAAVDAAAAYAKAHPDAKFTLSGFTDATGSAASNAKLAKTRAEAVRDALKAAGIAEDRIILKKPETITGGARRERSPARRDQPGCLTCRACSGKELARMHQVPQYSL